MYRYFIQPQLDKFTNSLIGYELLMKKYQNNQWQTPRYFSEIPADTISTVLVATTEKLALKIGAVSVNLNRTQMVNPQIRAALIKSQDLLRPVRLTIELTEEPGDNGVTWETLKPSLEELIARGIDISIDDIGTGKNEIERARRIIPYAAEIKFALQNFEQDFSDADLQNQVLYWQNIAHENHMRFILEGIENTNDDEIADNLEINFRQGYFYGKPHLLKINPADPS
ncbi:EAL domain-containing protein [Pediococcus argentinicus]|uniref:EAL domain-containing protein n=1 Tax=Pediococcus argentinicus TaxID=480391 RepID=UPI00338DC17A